MKIGHLVKCREKPGENEEHEIGIVVGFQPRGYVVERLRDPDCDGWEEAIVMWPEFGVAFHMRTLLEVISESR